MRSVRVRGVLLGAVLLLPLTVGCADSSSDATSDRSSLAALLVERYGGDLKCVQAVVDDADDSTAESLRIIASQGVDVNRWQEQSVLESVGRVMGC